MQNQDSHLMVFDAEDGQLIGLEQAESQTVSFDITQSDDVLVFPIEQNSQQIVRDDATNQLVDQSEASMVSESEIIEPLLEKAVAQVASSQQQDVETNNLMPQDILKLPVQVLEGEWNLEKWEYWFRNSELSPAVQELAQHGVMTGQIDGASVFHIPQEYEGMLTQLQHALESALKENWINTQFSVKYGQVDSTTPFAMQAVRKEKAFHRAVNLLQQEPTLKGLIETFDAELHNIQLKP